MNLETLKTKITDLDLKADEIRKECGYSTLSSSMEHVALDVEDPDACFLYDELKDILNVLDFIHYKLEYLQKDITHEGILQYNKKNGYELNGIKLDYESRIEVLATDENTQNSKWELHYLTDYGNLGGMRARIRE